MAFFDLSGELILLILEELDPISLLQFCMASRAIYTIIGCSNTLRYRYELALCGMRDVPAGGIPSRDRLAPLLGYKRGWSTLSWTKMDKLCFTPPTIMGVSGNYFYQARQDPSNNEFQWSLHLYELRSFRTTPRDKLHFYQYNVPFEIRRIAIDVSQSLMVWAHLYFPPQPNTAILASLFLRDLHTGFEHRDAAEARLRFPTDWWGLSTPGERVSIEQVQICGSIVGVSVRLELKDGMGATELALFNWRHGGSPLRAFSGDFLSYDILSDTCLIIISQPDEDEDNDSNGSNTTTWSRRSDGLYANERGKRAPQLDVYEISHEPERLPCRMRSYEFPESWTTVSFFQLCPNSSLTGMMTPAAGTLFYNDPSLRLTAITFEFPHSSKPAGCSRKVVVVVAESDLQPAEREEAVRWEEWQHRCMVLNLPDSADAIQLAGRRLICFENVKNPATCPEGSTGRAHVLDLNSHTAEFLWSLCRRDPPWKWQESLASLSTVFNHRGCNYVRTSTSETHNLTWIDATEDALVLYDEREGQTCVRILTFGRAVESSS